MRCGVSRVCRDPRKPRIRIRYLAGPCAGRCLSPRQVWRELSLAESVFSPKTENETIVDFCEVPPFTPITPFPFFVFKFHCLTIYYIYIYYI